MDNQTLESLVAMDSRIIDDITEKMDFSIRKKSKNQRPFKVLKLCFIYLLIVAGMVTVKYNLISNMASVSEIINPLVPNAGIMTFNHEGSLQKVLKEILDDEKSS